MSSGGDERFGCPGVVPVEVDLYVCGLLAGHRGACTPNVGDYLPPVILHPLDAHLVPVRLRACGIACPNGHGRRGRWHVSSIFGGRMLWTEPSFGVEGPVAAFRHFEDGAWLPPESELLWRFEPCGCEFRQIVADGVSSS